MNKECRTAEGRRNDRTADCGRSFCFSLLRSAVPCSAFIIRRFFPTLTPPLSRPGRGSIPVLLLAVMLAAGCGERQTRLDVYFKLMIPLEQAKYRLLEAEGKPVSLRLAYLQEIGVYQKWAEQPKNIQQAILRCQVLEGMTPLQVQMAWGLPGDRRDGTLPEDQVAGRSVVIWDYDLASEKSGDHYERSVCFRDDRVLWVRSP